MIQYTLVFLFDQKLDKVALIQKTHPDWQKGFLNGIGGRVEGTEDHYVAAERELKEECGVDAHVHHFMNYYGKKYEPYVMYVFWAMANFSVQPPQSKTEEDIIIVSLKELTHGHFVRGVPHFLQLALQAARNGDRL